MSRSFLPVTYSAAARRAIEKTLEQVRLAQDYLGMPTISDERRLVEYAKIVGLAIALVNIAESHRQWDQHREWGALQIGYARLLDDAEQKLQRTAVR